MKRILWVVPLVVVATALVCSSVGFAQAPAGSTGECKDGTYTSAESKRGACHGHGGVKTWYSASTSEEKKGAKAEVKQAGTTAAPPSTAAAPSTAKPAAETKTSSKAPQGARAEAAPGGGAGKVWVNTSSHVYHCMGDEWYGKTKQGEYMTEADAKAKGAHASHGKACS